MASFRRAQIPVFPVSFKCSDHNEEILMVCKQCVNAPICLKCLTTTHKQHDVAQLDEVAADMKSNILKTMHDSAEKQLQPKVTLLIDTCTALRESKEAERKHILKQITKRQDYLKRMVDDISKRKANDIERRYKETDDELKDEISQHQNRASVGQKFMSDCQDVINLDQPKQVVLQTKEIQDKWHEMQAIGRSFVEVQNKVGRWIHDDFDGSILGSAIGRVSFAEAVPTIALPSNDIPARCSRMRIRGHTDQSVTSITVLDNNKIWIVFNQRDLVLVDRNGTVQQTLTIEEGVSDIAGMSNKMLIVGCLDNKIQKLSIDGTIERGDGQLFEQNIDTVCVDAFDNLFAGLSPFDPFSHGRGCLGVYDTDGCFTMTKSYEPKDGDQIFWRMAYPCRVRMNSQTGHFVVIFVNWNAEKLDSKVVLYDNVWREKFAFDNKITATGEEKLVFTDACFDKNDYLVVSESSTRSLFVVSLSGEVKRRIRLNNHKPYALCLVDGQDIWIGCENGTICVMQC